MSISTRVGAPSNPGAVEGTNAELTYAQRVELFQTIFTGTVLSFVEEMSIFKKRTTVKAIQNGQSARFEAIGKTTGAYMAAGDSLGGGGINHNKVEVSLDELYVAHVSIFWPDEDQLHFEAIPKYAEKCAEAVSNKYDSNVFNTLILASKQSTPVVSDYPKMIGSELTYGAVSDEVNVEKVKDMISVALSTQKKKGYKATDLTMVCDTETMARLRRDDDFVSVDRGASGSIAKGDASMYLGVNIIEDIYFHDRIGVQTDTSGKTGGTNANKYDVDTTKLHFVVFAIDATATVELYGLKPILFDFEKEMSTYLGTYMKVGHGVLNPGGALTVWTA